MWTRIVTVMILVGGVACGGNGGSGGPDSSTGCSADGQCSGATPACDLDTHTCVECTDSNVMACSGVSPTCNSDNTCAPVCAADEDCESGACLGDGSCAETNRVLYVTADPATGDCTKANKCDFATALTLVDATKNVIHLEPLTYSFATGFSLLGTFTITGIGAKFHVAAGPGHKVFLIPSDNDVTIDFIEFGGVEGDRPDEALECTNGTATLRGVTASFTAGIAINSSGCPLRIERSIIHDAELGGIEIGGGTPFAVFDNIIHHNGDPTSTVGGVRLLGSTEPGSRFEFNTVVDNTSGPTTSVPPNAGGVACSPVLMIAAANNIIARNTSNATTDMTTQTVGSCTFPTSLVQADVTDIKFASPDAAPFSYKLTAGSSAIDQATTQSTVKVDFEGDSRPQGVASDIGADELE